MTKFTKPFYRVMDRAWLRDSNGIVYTGEALNLAMLMHVRKGRDRKREEELKDLLGVLPSDQPHNNSKTRRKPRKNARTDK